MRLRSINDAKTLKYEQGTHDLRNYTVTTSDKREKLGTVDDVLVDERGRARYVCVRGESDNRHALVPVGSAKTDSSDKRIIVTGMDRSRFGKVPTYNHDPSTIDDKYERKLTSTYEEGYGDDRYYDRPDFRSATWGRSAERRDTNKLERLDRLDDYKVADGDPDPRGWTIVGREGRTLGEVDHLIGDTGSMRVRYLVVKLDKSLDKNHRNVLVPVGHVDLDTRRNRVVARGLDMNCMTGLPEYKGGTISRDYERSISTACETSYSGEARYHHPRFRDDELWKEETISRSEEELRVGKREHKVGEVDVHKSVETERVRTPVTVHREEVEVERRPASGNARAEFGDREIRVPVTEEEVVVEKRPRVVEEIVVRKRDIEDTEFVDETVRKERVEIEDERPRR